AVADKAPAGPKTAPPAEKEKAKAIALVVPKARELNASLKKEVQFNGADDPRLTLVELLDQLAKIYGVAFDVNERAFKFDNLNDVLRMPIAQDGPIPPMQATLGTVLTKVLSRIPVPHGATFLIRNNHIEITTQAFVKFEMGMEADRQLLPLVWEEIEERPLSS